MSLYKPNRKMLHGKARPLRKAQHAATMVQTTTLTRKENNEKLQSNNQRGCVS